MDLLAHWRFDNYQRDLEAGAGIHFNSNQSRLHTAPVTLLITGYLAPCPNRF